MVTPTKLRSFACASVALAIALPSPASADSSWLVGAQTGALYRDGPGPPEIQFRIGAGLDWLHASGPTLLVRLETTHLLDTTLAVMGGWSGAGLLEGRGLPIGIGVGPKISLDHRGEGWWGGRTTLRYSLWYARAVLELDVGLEKQLDPQRSDAPRLSVGLVLRVVPIP